MTIEKLVPTPLMHENFTRRSAAFVPATPGCYVLTTFDKVVLYIGQAVSIRRRMNDHLADSQKTGPTPLGKAFFFYWLECEDIAQLERTWLNVHGEHEPTFPILNKVNSPVSV